MIVSTTALLGALALLLALSQAAPAGSKHTVYLATCVPEDCPIGLCDPEDFNLIAAGYFRNGPPTSTYTAPTALGTLSGFSSSWEGTKRSVRLGTDGTFTSNISAAAKTAAKGDIAGDGTLAGGSLIGDSSEPFICFKDGSTKFRATHDLDDYTCTAAYYCPSVDVGTS